MWVHVRVPGVNSTPHPHAKKVAVLIISARAHASSHSHRLVDTAGQEQQMPNTKRRAAGDVTGDEPSTGADVSQSLGWPRSEMEGETATRSLQFQTDQRYTHVQALSLTDHARRRRAGDLMIREEETRQISPLPRIRPIVAFTVWAMHANGKCIRSDP